MIKQPTCLYTSDFHPISIYHGPVNSLEAPEQADPKPVAFHHHSYFVDSEDQALGICQLSICQRTKVRHGLWSYNLCPTSKCPYRVHTEYIRNAKRMPPNITPYRSAKAHKVPYRKQYELIIGLTQNTGCLAQLAGKQFGATDPPSTPLSIEM